MKQLRMAVIGSGQIAQVTHIPNYRSMEEVEIAGICDTRIEAARSAAEKFGIKHYYDSHRKMLEELKPDAVTVCVPNKFHCRIVLDALEAGCHVFCEKPPAITVEEAISMENAAKRKGKLLSYGFHFRSSSQVSFLKNRIEKGYMGEIYHTEVKWNRRRGIPGWGCFTNKEIQGGGPLIDIGAHMLDCALYLLDYPEISYVCAAKSSRIGKQESIGLMGGWDPEKFTVEDGLFGFVGFKNGTSLELQTAFAINQKERDARSVKLYGSKEGADLFPLELYGTEDGQLTDRQFPFMEMKDWHMDADRNFVQACMGRSRLLAAAEQGTYVQRVLCALYESADTGMPVIMK